MTDALVTDCIFCRIIAGQAPADVVAQDDEFVAFRDAHPIAPVHLLAVPRRHLASLDEIDRLDAAAAGRMLRFVAAAARAAGVAQNGYRVVSNSGRDGGQMVQHLHWHIVGGRRLGGIA
jgi:histidine triad (HIT) family protein